MKENKIRLYNVFCEEDNSQKLSVEELYLYSLLRYLCNFNNEIPTNINLLDDYSRNYFIKFHSKKKESKLHIKNYLLSLANKKVINIDRKITNYDMAFTIRFEEELSGYEFISFDLLESITDMKHWYIYFVVAKWKKRGYFQCSWETWGNILGIHKDTAKKYVNQCVDSGLIYKNLGDYTKDTVRNGQTGQETYQFKISPFKDEEKSNMQIKKEREQNEESTINIDSDEWGESSTYPFETGNWLKNSNLDTHDYVIYLKHKQKGDPISLDFISECDKKRNRLDSAGKFKKFVEKNLMTKAKEIIDKEKEEKLEKNVKNMLNQTNDIVLEINGKLIAFSEWDQKEPVDKVYYYFLKFEPIVDDYIRIVRSKHKPDREFITEVSPRYNNGEWDNEQRELERNMKEMEKFESDEHYYYG